MVLQEIPRQIPAAAFLPIVVTKRRPYNATRERLCN